MTNHACEDCTPSPRPYPEPEPERLQGLRVRPPTNPADPDYRDAYDTRPDPSEVNER
jgi:hypothetical protein